MTEQAEQKEIVLGPEYDEDLRDHVRAVLRESGGQIVDQWQGMGGSQEVQNWAVDVGGQRIEIEAETYVGLAIRGNADIVDRIATLAIIYLTKHPLLPILEVTEDECHV